VEIVDARLNVSAAAKALHLSQPSVSRQLGLIEGALGFRVFARQGRSLVAVTPAGAEAIEVARRIVRDVDGLKTFAANARNQVTGELSIVAPQSYVLHVLPPLLSQLRARYPEISVSIRTLGEGEPVRPAEHDRCDMVLLSTAGDERPEGTAVPLFRWQRVAIVLPSHPLASHKGALALEQLTAWPLVTYEASRRPDSSFCRVMATAGLKPQFACSAHDGDTIKTYVRAGLGVGVVAELALSQIDRAELAVIDIEQRLPWCTAWAVLPVGRVLRLPTVDLLCLLAPQLDPNDIRRAAKGLLPPSWPEPPEHRRPTDDVIGSLN